MKQITTKYELISLFKKLGLKKGDDVMVHSSLKSLGYLVNGPDDVIDALINVISLKHGTILMPAHTGQLTHPGSWKNPAVPKNKIRSVKLCMKPFQKNITQVRGRGLLASKFLFYPGVIRSDHPLNSVSAIGKRKNIYTETHDFHEPEGINSPIGKLYKHDGIIIGIGVTVDRFTSIHHAEYLADTKYLYKNNPKVLVGKKNGVNIFKRIKKYPGDSKNFIKVLPLLRSNNLINEVSFKNSTMTYLKIKPVTDFIVKILNNNPNFLIEEDLHGCI